MLSDFVVLGFAGRRLKVFPCGENLMFESLKSWMA